MIYLILFFNCIFFSSFQAAWNFNKSSQIVIKNGTNFELLQPMTISSGELVIESGASISGSGSNNIVMTNSTLVDRTSSSEKMEGSFVRQVDLSSSIDKLRLTDGQKVSISGPVYGDVIISGLGNSIYGSPKFTKNILLLASPASSLSMGIFGDCDVNIDLAGGTLLLDHSLKMAPGKKIYSSSGASTIALNTETLFIGGVSGAWSEQLTFTGSGKINLTSDLALAGSWVFNGNTTISSDGNTLSITNPNASITIGAGATLEIDTVVLEGLKNGKLIFQDDSSTLKVSSANIVLTGDFDQSQGNLITSSSNITIGTYYWKLSSMADFQHIAGELWLDTLASEQPPSFGQTNAFGFTSFVNNSTIKQKVDFQKVAGATNRFLISGNVNQSVFMQTNLDVIPSQEIRVTEAVKITSSGTAINFSKSDGPQLIIDPGKQLTLSGDNTLNVQANTIDIDPSATLVADGTLIINAADNVSIPSGTIKIEPQSTMVISGAGSGETKFGLSALPGGLPAKLNVGIGKVELKGVNFYNIEQATVERRIVNGFPVQGEFVLSGASKVHIKEDCKMNFRIKGNDNTFIIHKSGVKFLGGISFEDTDTNVLHIKFELGDEDSPNVLEFGDNSMQLYSSNGFAKLYFDDREVTILNSSINSFITGGHAFLSGETVSIGTNPIVQSVSDLGLGSSLFLMNDDTIENPFVYRSPEKLLEGRGKSFQESFKFPHLPKFENYFRNNGLVSRAPALRPTMRIARQVTGVNKGVIKLYNNSTLGRFNGSAIYDSLELQFTGNGTVKSVPRRQKRTVNPVKAPPNFQDSAYTDGLSKKDRIFISGTSNKFLVTGNLVFNPQLYLDEQSELVFEFDDSLDTPKALMFKPVDADGKPYLYMPKSSSIVFIGNGQVVFDSYLQIEFAGDPLRVLDAATGVFEDNRPSLIFKNYAQMTLESGQELLFFGKGQMLFQNNASLNLGYGKLTIGDSSSDMFNMTFDRQAMLALGSVEYSGNNTASILSSPAILSLAYGNFSMKYTKQSTLSIQNGGLLEFGLTSGQFTGAEFTELSFAGQSIINVQNFGRISLAQPSEDLSGSRTYDFFFDSLDSVSQGSGLMAFYTSASTSPLYEARIQPGRTFKSESINPYDCFKRFVRISKLRSDIVPNPDQLGLEYAVDYTNIDGNYALRTKSGAIVQLQADDKIRREEPGGGMVFGTAGTGTNFVILNNGIRQNT